MYTQNLSQDLTLTENDTMIVIGGIKYNQIQLPGFEKPTIFLNMFVLHPTPLWTHWWKKIFLDN
jgi:hypothetical protein